VRLALARDHAPLVLVDAPTSALAIGTSLIEASVAVRAGRAVVQTAAAFARAGVATPPVQRFDGRLRPGEALLWPAEDRAAARLGRLEPATTTGGGDRTSLDIAPLTLLVRRRTRATMGARPQNFEARGWIMVSRFGLTSASSRRHRCCTAAAHA
jgi:hypothetical protein